MSTSKFYALINISVSTPSFGSTWVKFQHIHLQKISKINVTLSVFTGGQTLAQESTRGFLAMSQSFGINECF